MGPLQYESGIPTAKQRKPMRIKLVGILRDKIVYSNFIASGKFIITYSYSFVTWYRSFNVLSVRILVTVKLQDDMAWVIGDW